MKSLIPHRNIRRAFLAVVGALTVGMSVTTIPVVASPAASFAGDHQISTAELHQALAPVALYPDTLLSHILIAATYPLDIVQAHRWQRANRALDTEDAVDAAELEGWHPSVTALVAFPDILERLSEDLDWTRKLGEAFLVDEERVLDQVQILREKAYVAGNLQKMEHVTVVREEKIIYIEPAITEILYVPYYDTRLVFGPWWWPDHPPRYWHLAHSRRVNRWGFFWGAGVHIHTDFVFAAPRWRDRRVVIYPHYRERTKRFTRAREVAQWREAQHWRQVVRRSRHDGALPSPHIRSRPVQDAHPSRHRQTHKDVHPNRERGKPAYRKVDKNEHVRYTRALKERRTEPGHDRHRGERRQQGAERRERSVETERAGSWRNRQLGQDKHHQNRMGAPTEAQRSKRIDTERRGHIPSALDQHRNRTEFSPRREIENKRSGGDRRVNRVRDRERGSRETSSRHQRGEKSFRSREGHLVK